MNLFKVLALSLLLTGCVTIHNEGLHPIITKNVIIYQESNNIKFSSLANIFKKYAYITKGIKYKNLKELKNTTNDFINEIKENNISDNYPIKASKSEIAIVKNLLTDTIAFISKNEIPIRSFQSYMNKSINIYVTEIIHYED